jgi:hypothetical protein
VLLTWKSPHPLALSVSAVDPDSDIMSTAARTKAVPGDTSRILLQLPADRLAEAAVYFGGTDVHVA